SVDDPDRSAQRMVAAGARLVIALADRPWGKREGRVADPSGHLWILSKTIEEVGEEDIRPRPAQPQPLAERRTTVASDRRGNDDETCEDRGPAGQGLRRGHCVLLAEARVPGR